MFDFILNILSLGIKPIYSKHLEYYKIIKEFRDKLPRKQNEATRLSEDEKENHPYLSYLKYINVVDLSTHKTSIKESDIDLFYNKLNNFDYRFMLFKKYYKNYTKNLNRFDPKASNKDFNLVMVQLVLKDNSLKPIKPIDVIVFNLKWEFKATSRVYVWFLKLFKKLPRR